MHQFLKWFFPEDLLCFKYHGQQFGPDFGKCPYAVHGQSRMTKAAHLFQHDATISTNLSTVAYSDQFALFHVPCMELYVFDWFQYRHSSIWVFAWFTSQSINKFNLLIIQYHLAYLTLHAGITCGSLGTKRQSHTVSRACKSDDTMFISFNIVMMVPSFVLCKYSQHIDEL